jgi:hypothetical protein
MKQVVLFLIILLIAPHLRGQSAEWIAHEEWIGHCSEKYPEISLITSYKGNVYFAGKWERQAVVVRYDNRGHFTAYTSDFRGPFKEVSYDNGKQRGLLFDRGIGTKGLFSFTLNKWIAIPHDSTFLACPDDERNYTTDGRTLFLNDNPKRTFKFPLPDRITFRRWRGTVLPLFDLEASIGESYQIGRYIWFMITYYDGEGQSGVGGLGLFDTVSKRFGVFRDSLLASCSSGRMVRKGDTLFILTTQSQESGIFSDRGLVVLDLKNMRIASVNNSPPMDGVTFSAGGFAGNTLWMATENAIVGWNLETNEWLSWRVESVRTEGKIGLYRDQMRTVPDEDHPSYGPTRLDTLIQQETTSDSAVLKYYWDEKTYNRETEIWREFTEVRSERPVIGWTKESDFKMLDTLSAGDRASIYPVTIYSDSTLVQPFSTFKFGEFKKLAHHGDGVKAAVNSLWADPDSLVPLFTIQSQDSFAPQWRSIAKGYSNMEEMAFATFDSETIAVPDSFLAYDTVLVFKREVDPYLEYHDVLEAHWLPFDESHSPSGIQFGVEGDYDNLSISIRDSAIWVDNRKVSIGYTRRIRLSECTATMTLLGYTIQPGSGGNAFEELIIKYTLWITNSHQNDEENDDE